MLVCLPGLADRFAGRVLPFIAAAALTHSSFADDSRRLPPTPPASTSVHLPVPRPSLRELLPPPPEGCGDLSFGEIFAPPGRRGLEYSSTARSLDGHRVRLVGWMARNERPTPGTFLFAPEPTVVAESHYAQADDLPVSTVLVSVPAMKFSTIRAVRGPLIVKGILSLGGREEPGGRTSWVRLVMDDHLDVAVRHTRAVLQSAVNARTNSVGPLRATSAAGVACPDRSDPTGPAVAAQPQNAPANSPNTP